MSGDAGSSVLKFGGTALDGPEGVRGAVRLVRGRPPADGDGVVVVSALAGVTDSLHRAADAAASGEADAPEAADGLAERHLALLEEVADGAESAACRSRLERRAGRLREALEEVLARGRCPPARRDEIISYGERLCAPVVAAALRSAGVDAEDRRARRLVVTTEEFGEARLDWPATREAVRAGLDGRGPTQVVPGFVGASRAERTTTLGRGGSDFTAVALAAALGIGAVEIFSDVDGVMTADPSLVPDGRVLPALSWEEMWVLSRFGADVLQARAAWMARDARIRLRVRNVARPRGEGTRVGPRGAAGGEDAAVGVASAPRGTPSWRPPLVGVDDGAPAGAAGLLAVGDARTEERAVVAVVGVRDREAARSRLATALEGASVSVLAAGHAPADSLALAVPASQRRRAVAAIHATLFEEPSPRPALETGGKK